jgi:Fe-S-cluster containining protein
MSKKFYKNGLKFSCLGCGECCKLPEGRVQVSQEEIRIISDFLDIEEKSPIGKFVSSENGIFRIFENTEKYCIFLENNECAIYPVRPLQCRTFPFWPENLKSQYRWNQLKEFCPGIDNEKHFTFSEINQICSQQKMYDKLLKQVQMLNLLGFEE